MHFPTLATAFLAVLSKVSTAPAPFGPETQSCVLHDIPATSVCGVTRRHGQEKAHWYLADKRQNIDACIKSCQGACKAVSFDDADSTCRYYSRNITTLQLSGTSGAKFYDLACGFGASSGATCGRPGWAGWDSPPPFDSKIVANKRECLEYCRNDTVCEAARFHTTNKRCFKYSQSVKETGVTVDAEVPSLWYDLRCLECQSARPGGELLRGRVEELRSH